MQTALTILEWYVAIGLAFASVGVVKQLVSHRELFGPLEVFIIILIYPWIIWDITKKWKSGELQ